MNDLELGHRLNRALNNYTDRVPLPNMKGPVFRPWANNDLPAVGAPGLLHNGRRRVKARRVAIVIAVILSLLGTGAGLAAASGAFDQSAHRTAVVSFDRGTKLMLQSIRAGFNRSFAAEYGSVMKSFKPKDVVLEASAQGPNDSTFTVWTYSNHSSAPWCEGIVVTVPKKPATGLGEGCQLSGTSQMANTAGEQNEWPCSPSSAQEYFAVAGKVPSGVSQVELQTPNLGSVIVPVANRWFITIEPQEIPGFVSESYLDGSGAVVGTGTWNGGTGTC